MHTLGELLDGLADEHAFAPQRDRPISGIFDDSRQVQPGGLFVALRGAASDGRRFIGDALARGAAVVLGEELAPDAAALHIRVPDARGALARLAARWYGLNGAGGTGLALAGVTGTNGKSTTAFMARAILQAGGRRCGLLGTVQYELCGRTVTANMTTPGPLELAAHLRECADNGASCAVLEVSSHALDQKRTDGLRFRAAAFTNLTGDHLDYHGTMESYRAAKRRLFLSLAADAVAVLNRDDPSAAEMARGCPARILWYSLDSPADLSATITRTSVSGTHYRLRLPGHDLVLENALVGRHNVYNALAAAGLALALGATPGQIQQGLTSVRNVPGRLQRVPCVRGAEVFVDYAHSDDALRNVLSVLRPLAQRRLICVFGCGGDRDRTKRPRMARVAAELSDAIVVTSDNPRTEAPEAIIAEIMTGFDESARGRVRVEPDRARAIGAAVASAGAGDIVLIAGKGHEDYQIVGAQKLHFDDVEAAIQAAERLARAAAGGRPT